jgi:ssDNA-binding Zn-finger/Zn-ribbon topoisomerase 1
MIVRTGRRGQFLGCSGYPKCKNTSEVPARLAEEMGLSANGNGHGSHAAEARPEKHVPLPDEIETDLAVD